MAYHIKGKHPTTELRPQPSGFYFVFWERSLTKFPRQALNLKFSSLNFPSSCD